MDAVAGCEAAGVLAADVEPGHVFQKEPVCRAVTGALAAHGLLGCVGHEFRVLAQAGQLLRVQQQRRHAQPDLQERPLVAGHEQLRGGGHRLALGELVVVVACRDERAEVLTQFPGRGLDLLERVVLRDEEGLRPRAKGRAVTARRTQHVADPVDGQRTRVCLHDVGRVAALLHCVEELVGELVEKRLQQLQGC
ncbi:hypothetical protein ABTZ93_35655 [Streptomyces sp. NPDC097941]|uniref:hypothetical protein n=1 Tax=Streptomyces sp. NPDC097941 TaxID=3155685 RepID=UPI00331ECDA5